MRLLALSSLLVSLASQCGAQEPRVGPSTPPAPSKAVAHENAAAAVAKDAGVVAPSPGPMFVLATDAALMADLEAKGASLAALLEGAPSALANDELAAKPRYASMLRVFDEDVRDVARRDPAAGVGMAKAHRLLDVAALRSKRARFELVGVTHRLDRGHVRPGTCGEARFIYRLAYATKQATKDGAIDIASRLPATLAVTYWLRPPATTKIEATATDCAKVAALARVPSEGVTAAWLLSERGPFGGLPDLRTRFKAVEANLQIVRWPSTTRPDLAGHAEYAMRVFETKGDALVPAPLENTLDVSLFRTPAKVGELERFVRGNLDAIDFGTVRFPDLWAAKKSVSVSPRGLARLANRPFRQVLDPKRLSDLDLAGRANIASPEALVRRLDQLTCAGCHQSRSVAGFHLLGEDRVAGANSVAVPLSPHLLAERARRAAGMEAVAEGRGFGAHPSPERGLAEKGHYGARCGLGDRGFARWTCDDGLTCQRGDRARGEDTLLGTCLPSASAAGDPCESMIVEPNADGMRDRGTMERKACGPGAGCGSNLVGFPGGLCAVACSSLASDPNGVCAGIPILTSFNACLARSEPFEACIAANTNPSGVRGCDAANPCREDYICAGAPSVFGGGGGGGGKGRGACMPPYFLFQLRVDGHPVL